MREALQSGWRALEHGFDAAFGAALNPLRHLGALGFLMFWLLAASGIYLYAVLDTSAETENGNVRGLPSPTNDTSWSSRNPGSPIASPGG